MGRHFVSPDCVLRLLVHDVDGDIVIGFEGFPWHTHAGSLAEIYGGDWQEAVDQYVRDIITNKSHICILKKHGDVVDIWVTDDPSHEHAYGDETLEIRQWSTAGGDII